MAVTYQNPVWQGYLADPFVLKWRGEYYAYGTGSSVGNSLMGERMFPVLHSTNLAHWTLLGGALEPLRGMGAKSYWAPEVAENGGKFYLYYSADRIAGRDHQLRVAIADHPAGPFLDCQRVLLPDEPFSIDAHPFCDPKDGKWYLFFAKDFFDGRVGTGTAVIRLADDMMTVLGESQPVLRASVDWHIHAHDHKTYGKWHTAEGAFVLFREGLYYCFYSGGSWQTPDYGVGYGVAENVMGPYHHRRNDDGPSVLKGIPGQVLGPGHNSVVIGPDDRTQYIVYHAWDPAKTARRMCIDPLEWTENGPRCAGPTFTPQIMV